MRIAIDIDGILTIDTEGHDYRNRIPNWDNINHVNRLYYEGHDIILFTSRHRCDRRITKQWLRKFNVHYHKLIMRKPKYDILIDDKAKSSF
jgi:uncharacterized HAD superfamily protein